MSAAERLARAREQIAEQRRTPTVAESEHIFITPQRARYIRGLIEADQADAGHDAELAARAVEPPPRPDTHTSTATRPTSVYVGGPRAGWVAYTADLDQSARAAEHMGSNLGYVRTDTYQAETGHRRWTWDGTTAGLGSAGSFDPDAAYWHSPTGLSQYAKRRKGGRR